MQRNYYEVLGFNPSISSKLTSSHIKKAYLKKAILLHPDHNKEPDAAERFAELQTAYETLMDENKRYSYDYPSYNFANVTLEEEQRKKQRDEAYQKLSGLNGLSNKIAALFVSILIIAIITALAALASALLCLAYPFFLGALIFAPKQLGRFINQENLFTGLLSKLFFGLIAAPILICTIPVIGLGLGLKNIPAYYKETAVKGLSTAGKVILAGMTLATTAALFVFCPPAGLASTFAAGGGLASTLGMGSFGTGAFASCLAAITFTAISLVSFIAAKTVQCFNFFFGCKPKNKNPIPTVEKLLLEDNRTRAPVPTQKPANISMRILMSEKSSPGDEKKICCFYFNFS